MKTVPNDDEYTIRERLGELFCLWVVICAQACEDDPDGACEIEARLGSLATKRQVTAVADLLCWGWREVEPYGWLCPFHAEKIPPSEEHDDHQP